MQALKAEVTIQVPENMVLVEKTEYMQLKEQKEFGKPWGVKELNRELELHKSLEWLRWLLRRNQDDIKDWCNISEMASGKLRYTIRPSGARKWFEENMLRIDWDEPLPK